MFAELAGRLGVSVLLHFQAVSKESWGKKLVKTFCRWLCFFEFGVGSMHKNLPVVEVLACKINLRLEVWFLASEFETRAHSDEENALRAIAVMVKFVLLSD